MGLARANTKVTGSSRVFSYEIKRPMAVDRFFSLEKADHKGVHMTEGNGAWKRGQGCAVLKLSDKPKRGAKASVLSMVGGNLILKYSEPKNNRWWPSLTLRYWVLTVDWRGNMLFPTNWSPNAEILLKELARRKIKIFWEDQEHYPIRANFCTTPGISSAITSKDNNPSIPVPTAPTDQ